MQHDFSKLILSDPEEKFLQTEEDSRYFAVVGRKTTLLIRSLYAIGYSDKELYLETFGFPSRYKPFYDSSRNILVDKAVMAYEVEQMIIQKEKNPNYLIEIAERCKKTGEELLKISRDSRSKNLSILTDEELKTELQKNFEATLRMSTYLLFPIAIQNYLENRVRESLTSLISDEKQRQIFFHSLTTPIKGNTGYYEQIAILELAKKYRDNGGLTSDLEIEISSYLAIFDVQGVKYGYGELWTKEDILDRLEFLSLDKELDSKLTEIKELEKKNSKQVEMILSDIKAEKNLYSAVEVTRIFIYLRTYRSDILSAASANIFPLLDEVGKRNNLPRSLVYECFPNEILAFQFPSRQNIEERITANVCRGYEGRIYYVSGDRAKKIVERVKGAIDVSTNEDAPNNEEKKIVGTIANRGFVQGAVKVVIDNTELKKVEVGDILVSGMTTPDFVPAMEKAAAFVTDEGGILCHAAIMSREMKKPCIIGTKIATQVLKDGDMVEVDADNGIVRIIK